MSCTHCFGRLSDQTCVSTCPGGYYVDKGKQECVQCHVKCASCLGHHSNDCITCKPGLLLLRHSCFTTCPLRYHITHLLNFIALFYFYYYLYKCSYSSNEIKCSETGLCVNCHFYKLNETRKSYTVIMTKIHVF